MRLGARGKRRGFSPGAAARHSQSARAHTDSRQKTVYSQKYQVEPALEAALAQHGLRATWARQSTPNRMRMELETEIWPKIGQKGAYASPVMRASPSTWLNLVCARIG